jgi:hypothetical protein
MYSDDDPTLKPRPVNTGETPKQKKSSDDDDDPEPWNAVCIVGFRVYSKDEGLEVKLHEEGEEDDVPSGMDKIEEEAGTDGDDEDGEVKKKKVVTSPVEVKDERAEKGEEPKKTDDGETELPLRRKETDELVLVDGEKKAMGLASEESTLSTDGGASITAKAMDGETKAEIPEAPAASSDEKVTEVAEAKGENCGSAT